MESIRGVPMKTLTFKSWVIFAGLVCVLDPIVVRGQSPSASGVVQRLSQSASATRIAPGDHAEIMRLIGGVDEAIQAPERTQLSSTAAHWLSRVADQVKAYPVVNVEFKDADSCRLFNASGTTIITKFSRFADMFLGDQTVLDKLCNDPGIVWIEHAGQASAPPPRLGRGYTSQAAAEPIIRNGLG